MHGVDFPETIDSVKDLNRYDDHDSLLQYLSHAWLGLARLNNMTK